jgi:ribosomal protein S18 acetylase RimI-like enzyme
MVIFPPNQETLVRSILVGGVAPAHRGRGIGRALLQWQQRRALQQLATSSKTLPGMIVVAADERATAATRAITRAGFIPDRFFQTLARPTQQPIANGSVVPGITIAPWSAGYSRPAHAARDSAFRNHGSSQPMSEEQWDSMLNMSTAAPVHSFVAVDGAERVVGVLLTLLGAEDEESGSSGYVWVLGVVPEMRRQGIATALLTAHLRSLAVAGIDRSVLDVATDTPGAGIELFDGLGYSRTALSVNYVQVY